MFWKDTLESFATVLLELLGEDGLDEGDTEVKLTFASSGCVLGGFLPSLKDYNEEECFIREPDLWLQKVEKSISDQSVRTKPKFEE